MTKMKAVPLGECVCPVKTWNPANSADDEEFNYIDISSVDQVSKAVGAMRAISCAEAPSRARQLVTSGDVIVSTVRPNLNAVAKLGQEHEGATASTGFCVIRPNPSMLDGAYAFQWVKSPGFIGKMMALATGASYPAVSDKIILGSSIPLPPLPEQRQIAAILDQADALRAHRRQALADLDMLAQAVFVEMFGDTVTNPMGWPSLPIGKLADVQGGLQVTSARKELPNEAPYLRVANVHRGYLLLDEIKTIRATSAEIARTTLLPNDLLVVEGHGNPEEIGRAALWGGEIRNCVHQNHLIRVRFDASKVGPVYACTYLNSPGGRRHLLRAGKTTSGLNTISVSNVRDAPVALPPIDLQQTFATRLQAIESLKATHRAALAESNTLFASLQHRAFSGAL